jgi:hypothetical protein
MAEVLRDFPTSMPLNRTFLGTTRGICQLQLQRTVVHAGLKNADELTQEDEIIARAFQVNHERLMSRWSWLVEPFERSPRGGAQALVSFTTRLARSAAPRSWPDGRVLLKPTMLSAKGQREGLHRKSRAALRKTA